MNKLQFNKIKFLRSDFNINGHYISSGIEVALLGYSNSGKSSVINALTSRRKKIAFVSKKPGSTKTINFFKINSRYNLVDLPGYGYSLTSIKKNLELQKIIFNYLLVRNCLIGIIIVMDIRFPMKKIDKLILKIIEKKKINVIILLNKSDKYNFIEQKKQFNIVKKEMNNYNLKYNVIFFSSTKKIGINSLQSTLNYWYNISKC